jgi:hypothetical protein
VSAETSTRRSDQRLSRWDTLKATVLFFIMETFSYTEVLLEDLRNSLRLVRLYSNPEDHMVECAIDTPQSYPPISYRALSYTWGDDSRKVPISFNGKIPRHPKP